MATASEFTVPAAARPVFDEVKAIATGFCRAHLDDEYASLCAKLAVKLARKRPSPLLRGDRRIWAAGIVYTIGQVNFLTDPGQRPHLKTDKLAELLGVKQTTMASKGRLIMNTLRLAPFDVEYSRQSIVAENPLAWLVSINGFLVDARGLSRELQADCVQRGLIPFMPLETELLETEPPETKTH